MKEIRDTLENMAGNSLLVYGGKNQEKLPSSPSQLLRERVWIMHWALFIFFNEIDTLNVCVEMFFSENFMNAIQTMAPHLLRYLTSAILIRVTSERLTKSRQLNECARYMQEVCPSLFSFLCT